MFELKTCEGECDYEGIVMIRLKQWLFSDLMSCLSFQMIEEQEEDVESLERVE